MALVRCILGKFLGVVCHWFPPRLDVPIPAAKCLHVRNDVRYPSRERWNYGRERLSGNFANMDILFTSLGISYMPQIYHMGPTALLPLRRNHTYIDKKIEIKNAKECDNSKIHMRNSFILFKCLLIMLDTLPGC